MKIKKNRWILNILYLTSKEKFVATSLRNLASFASLASFSVVYGTELDIRNLIPPRTEQRTRFVITNPTSKNASRYHIQFHFSYLSTRFPFSLFLFLSPWSYSLAYFLALFESAATRSVNKRVYRPSKLSQKTQEVRGKGKKRQPQAGMFTSRVVSWSERPEFGAHFSTRIYAFAWYQPR